MSTTGNTVLPKKEADLFRNLIRLYEAKQYKKAIKAADGILRKFPTHGETLAMKGLTINSMSNGQRGAEAHAMVKDALKYDMKSHVCWHVFGLLHRADHDYKQAASCYKQALRMDSNNLQILRDLGWLQLQLRDVHGFLNTRNNILTLKPALPLHWVSVAVAKHLVNDVPGAIRVIDVYLETTNMEVSQEKSELLMYQNELHAKVSIHDALEHLEKIKADIYDEGAWLFRKAYYLYSLAHFKTAAMLIRQALWGRGHTEDHQTHSLYMACRLEQPGWIESIDADEPHLSKSTGCRTVAHTHCSKEQRKTLLDIYQNDLAIQFPKSKSIAKRIPMTLITDQGEWLEVLQKLCLAQATIPSLYSEVCFYISDTPLDPVDLREHDKYKLCLEKLISVDGRENHLLAGGLYLRGALYEKALEHLNKDMDDTDPIDVMILKAEVLEKSGQLVKAVECMQQARKDDPADRYLNNAATKLLLRNDDIDEGINTINMFTRHEQNLFDMQCSWYELELAAAYERKEDLGRALKQYGKRTTCHLSRILTLMCSSVAVAKHFDDYHEDQFDFHSYCLRKVTLRAYLRVLRFCDAVYEHSFFQTAARSLVRIYVHLHDFPIGEANDSPQDFDQMSAADRKKAKAIARKKKKANEKKQQQQQEKQKEEDTTETPENGSGNAKNGKAVDPDPAGLTLLKKDALSEACKYSEMLARYAPCDVESWLSVYDVAVRRKKPLMALRACVQGQRLCPERMLSRVIDFVQAKNACGDGAIPDAAKTVLQEELPKLTVGHKSVEEYANDLAKKSLEDPKTSFDKRIGLAQGLLVFAATKPEAVFERCLVGAEQTARNVTVETIQQAISLVQHYSCSGKSMEWATSLLQLYPDAGRRIPRTKQLVAAKE